ncbi:MAG: hypothetical protein IT370_06410 [Deltaproteobacteria bacterium]|nr:hypothetical protein [Deltaproteobacteria bacterium]
MEMALDMTAGLPASAADRALIQAHYDSQLPTWLPIMKQYAYHHADNCWQQYFGLALVHHSTYGLLRQGGNPTVVAAVRGQVLADKLRPIVAGHRNAYFDFIAAAQGPAGLVPAGELATTVTQLAGFPPPPRASLAVDNSAQYPAKPGCANQSTGAVAIGQRVAQDFLWQHHPFRLRNEFVDARHVFPGADYLIAYWLGRQHGFISDDAPNTCTRWRGN